MAIKRKPEDYKAVIYRDKRERIVPYKELQQKRTVTTVPKRAVESPQNNDFLDRAGAYLEATNPLTKVLGVPEAIGNLAVKGAQEREANRNKLRDLRKSGGGTLSEISKLSASTAFGTPFDKLLAKGDPQEEWSVAAQAREKQQIGAERFKKGLGTGGRMVADIAIGAGNLAGDLAVSSVAGVPITALYGVTGGAEAARNALGEGYGANKALTAGAASGVVTSQIERLGGVGGNLAGKYIGKLAGTATGKAFAAKAPKAVEYIAKLANNKFGQILGSAASEGLEEFTEYDVQRVINNLILDKDTPRDVKEQLYNTVMGAGIGGLFGVASRSITNKPPQTATNAPTAAADTTAQQQVHIPAEAQGEDLQAAGAQTRVDTNEILGKLWDSIPSMALDAPVKNLSGNEFPKSDIGIVQQVGDFFRSLGNKVARKDFGDIIIDEAGVQSDIAHGLGRAKSITFAAVPDVIQSGRQIDYQKNWKNRGYDSYVFAAPVVVGGKRNYVTAIVVKGKDANFYLHEVLDGTGNIIYTKKEPGIIKTGITAQGGITSEPSSYNTTIPQGKNGVNTQYMQDGMNNTNGGTVKSQSYQRRVENTAIKAIADALSIPPAARREMLHPQVRELVDEIKVTGGVSPETREHIFRNAYARGVVMNEEFYNQYKDLKNTLRTTPITISEQDSHDIRDFNLFKKNHFGSIRLVNEGGMPVDVFYDDLAKQNSALFPADITHPADQLQKIAEISKSIVRVEMELDAYHGEDLEFFQAAARKRFDDIIDELKGEINTITRYIKDRAAVQDAKDAEIVLSELEVSALWDAREQAEKKAKAAEGKGMLTENDKMLVRQLLDGYIKELPPGTPNAANIRKTYEAKTDLYFIDKALNSFSTQQKAAVAESCETLLESSDDWKEPRKVAGGWLASTKTMKRNVNDIVTNSEQADAINEYLFNAVNRNEAESIRMRKTITKHMKALDIDNKQSYTVKMTEDAEPIEVTESGLVQLLGEKKISLAQISAAGADAKKIEKAVVEMRKIYNELFKMANSAYIRNGYSPMKYRADYFPHFEEWIPNGKIATFANKIGIKILADSLPTDLAGKTHLFRPAVRFFSNKFARKGDKTTFDALQGMDIYLDGIMDIINHTDDLRRLRSFESVLRKKYSRDGLQEEIEAVKEDTKLSDKERSQQIDELLDTDDTHLSVLAVELGRYTDMLAGKKNISDRDWEHKLGRWLYSASQGLEGRIAANMIGYNLSSALTNFIPLAQATAEIPPQKIISALFDIPKNIMDKGDGFVDNSDFLTSRRGYEHLTETGIERAIKVGGKPMELFDDVVSEAITRARYKQNKGDGMEDTQARAEADSYAAGLMGDRSKGATPTIFHERNFLTKLYTMFQLEVNNQFLYMTKDLPQNIRARVPQGKVKSAVTAGLFKAFIASYLLNDLYEKLIGRRPALDPIGIMNEAAGDLTGYELPNIFDAVGDMAQGQAPSFTTKKKTPFQTAKNLATNIAQEVPFVGSFLGGGRVPISGALPDIEDIAGAAMGMASGTMSGKKALPIIGDELLKTVAMTALPTGGNQIKKTAQGLETFAKGGSYKYNSKGEKQLQYNVEQNMLNLARSALFGKWSTPEAQDYVDGGFKMSSPKYTAGMEEMQKHGISPSVFSEIDSAVKSTSSDKDYSGKTIPLSKSKNVKIAIDDHLPYDVDQLTRFRLYEIYDVSKLVW